MQWVKKTICCLPSIWQSLHSANLNHVSEMHIFLNGTPCQSETCLRMAHVSDWQATRGWGQSFLGTHTPCGISSTCKFWHSLSVKHWNHCACQLQIVGPEKSLSQKPSCIAVWNWICHLALCNWLILRVFFFFLSENLNNLDAKWPKKKRALLFWQEKKV